MDNLHGFYILPKAKTVNFKQKRFIFKQKFQIPGKDNNNGQSLLVCRVHCSTDGCNGATTGKKLNFFLILFALLLIFYWPAATTFGLRPPQAEQPLQSKMWLDFAKSSTWKGHQEPGVIILSKNHEIYRTTFAHSTHTTIESVARIFFLTACKTW